MTTVTIRISVLGGPHDGFRGTMDILPEHVGADLIPIGEVEYRVHRQEGVTFLVHPSAQALVWPVP